MAVIKMNGSKMETRYTLNVAISMNKGSDYSRPRLGPLILGNSKCNDS